MSIYTNKFTNQDSDMLAKVKDILEASGPGKVKAKEANYEKEQKNQNKEFEKTKGSTADTTKFNKKDTELSNKGLDESGFSSPTRPLASGPIEKINTKAERTLSRSIHSKINSRVGKHVFDPKKNKNADDPTERDHHAWKIQKLAKNNDSVAKEIRRKIGATAKTIVPLPEENINELSKKTLKKYVNKAEDSLHDIMFTGSLARETGDKKLAKKQEKKFNNRFGNIEMARDRISEGQIDSNDSSPPFDPDPKKSTPWTSSKSKAKNLARNAMKKMLVKSKEKKLS